jgi:hypothetical protein
MSTKKNSTFISQAFFCLTLLSHLFSQSAQAGTFIIEPGLGYKQEVLKLTDKNTQALTKYSMYSGLASLKLQMYSGTGVSLGLAGEYSSGKTDIEPAASDRPEFSHFIGSFQLGVSAMESMKLYLGYAPVNELEFKSNLTFTGFKIKGHSYQAGIAFYPFSRFALSAQYNINIYKEIIGPNYTSGKDTDLYFQKMDSQDISFSLSYLL